MKQEDLGPTLYLRASHRGPWIPMIVRDEYPDGAGLSRSSFTIQRSEPSSDEEAWPLLTSVNSTAPDGASQPNTLGACTNAWNQANVGYFEQPYGPEAFGLVGPTLCQDELVLHWQSVEFWEKYFIALEMRNVRSLENRLANIYMNMVPHAAVVTPLTWGAKTAFNSVGLSKSTTLMVPPNQVYLGDLPAPSGSGATLNYGELTQEVLDQTATTLIENTSIQPDDQGWITMSPMGPAFLLLIGIDMSQRLLQNNADFRLDIRSGWDTFADANPLLKRRGASLVIKNWRHLITAIPPRWDWVTTGNDGQAIGPNHLYTEPNSGAVYGAGTNAINTPYGNPAGCWVRRPAFIMSTSSTVATKGYSAETNPDWTNAGYEGTLALNPWVFHEEILRPINQVANQNWQTQNYMGEWSFVSGIEAFAGIDGCVIPTGGDPLHTLGRHFARYRHAAHPIFPEYGRLFLWKRCVPGIQIYRCS